MRKGEKGIFIFIGVAIALVISIRAWLGHFDVSKDQGIPYYTTASHELAQKALSIYKKNKCKSCHTLWSNRDIMRTVPAPPLDGIGVIRTEDWFYEYLSAPDPKIILPSRLKKQFQMPSYAHLPESDRKILAKYLASLKVEDWYLEETKKREFEKLTGESYQP